MTNDLDEDVEEVLYRVDERTESIESDLKDVSESVHENEKDIDNIQSRVKRNSTVVNGLSVGGIAILTWVADKITRFYPS